ncbi:peptidase [Marmoricola endophyticus]|uniref:Peptidase n=1 Tax=Marmoricola endophyticus TaxID=2040280 RepID=A0A917BAB0_9ACTN|nr:P1 family peptidase [Marmoricola endophyticus]GGF34155.1 peptidase [Marmoricola endophyticus]
MDVAVDGVRVGHWTDEAARTGVTVVELPPDAVASYEARGGAPASRELELLDPLKSVRGPDAVVLSGGSAFGLAAADGVMSHYESLGRGVPTPGGRVPIVVGLSLFDLAVGRADVRPGPAEGLVAARATTGEQVLHGPVGAGTGAMVGQWRGEGRKRGGLGYATHRHGEVVVAALVAVNAFGDVDHGGEVSFDSLAVLDGPPGIDTGADHGRHTTIGVVVTNAALDKTECRVVAQGGHDGLARALIPPHTRVDGDALVAVATGQVSASVDVVRLLALACVADAVRSVDS